MSNPHLRLSGVHRHYGEGERMVRVLEAADMVVESGELVALVAPSGAGKSTLLHLCGLLEAPQAGEVEIVGVKTSGLNDRGRTQLRRSTVGYVYQFHHLLPEFSAIENVAMPQLIDGQSPEAARVRAQELLDLLGVGHRADHRPAELSGGEQQRVAIARAAANHPRVILADEPTGNLDPETSDRVFEALQSLIRNEGAAALIATHNYDLARRADRIVTLRNGQVVAHTL
ncbi:MAG: ABC transporter ATP-binding protein [Devosia sp.]|jgi:lipoprotein-releasing system ATP-binding protein|uniref:ABC transporter ATP-binding protein n=1 Tax=unclassified Devosia TaxID=196773 RepID=UPI0019EF373C|nr:MULTISPECIES: ABC transporter ATP-binding protein [unclassified Devosia]MBF0678116.1 ABC transporter ATP-binding protein [Devosia sp.]WEJ31379.1 ABC transporter ATP-binding protein [Devosia sp. SD17-2]